MSQMNSDAPLRDVKVLELGHIVAGPTASMILAEFGADVIKIERPGGGDQARLNKANQGHFISYNSNKRSVLLDIQSMSGRKSFLQLVECSDVLIDNFAPGALDRLGLGYDVLGASNPHLIHSSIKGFLPGPYDHRPLTDEPAQMMGGLAYMTGPRGQPLRVGTSVVDITGALFAALSVLTALYERHETGRGRQIHVGLFESVAFLVGQHVAKSTLRNEVPVPMPERGMGRDLGWGIYRIFKTKDNRDVFVGVLSDSHWERFCKEFALEVLWADPALRTNAGRAEQHERLGRHTEELIGSISFAVANTRLERAKIPYAPVNTPYDLVSDHHLRSIKFLHEVTAPDGRSGLIAGLPVASKGWFEQERRDPPPLGHDTEEVLSLISSERLLEEDRNEISPVQSHDDVDREIDAWVEATKKLTGKIVEEREPWIESVTEEAIRHFAQGTDDQNALWLAPSVGAKTRWGGMIAPPSLIFANRYPILHGAPMTAPLASLIGGLEADFEKPVRPGDRLSSEPRQKDFYEKRNTEGRRLNFVISEVTYRNQRNELVATARGTMIMATQVGMQKMMEHTPPRYADADLKRLDNAWRSEYRRGGETLYFEDVQVGSSIPEIVRGPLTIGDLVAWNAAIGPSYKAGSWGYLDLTRAMHTAMFNPVTNFPVKYSQQHEDFTLAAGRGMPAPFDNGVMRFAWAAPLITNWIGFDGWMRHLNVQVRRPGLYGDLTTYSGEVIGKDDATGTVKVKISGCRRDGTETTTGEAVVVLLRK